LRGVKCISTGNELDNVVIVDGSHNARVCGALPPAAGGNGGSGSGVAIGYPAACTSSTKTTEFKVKIGVKVRNQQRQNIYCSNYFVLF